jgi:hypothetical protein
MIDPAGDLIIQLYTSKAAESQKFIGGDGTPKSGRVLVSLKVSKQLLITNSKYFVSMFCERQVQGFAEAKQSVIDIEYEHTIGVELWLRAIHPNAMIDSMYSVEIKEVWDALDASYFFAFALEKLNSWFAEWIKRKGGDNCSRFNILDLAQLMYPCQEFDHPQSFADVTRRLAYEVASHISDDSPTDYEKIRNHPRILGKHYEQPS